jgi:hypothetical protein
VFSRKIKCLGGFLVNIGSLEGFPFLNTCILQYYLSKQLTSFGCSLNAVFLGFKMCDTFACASNIFVTHFIILIAVLENVPPDAGLQKRATFSTLNKGLVSTVNRTRATCMTSSGTDGSAIHYALSLRALKREKTSTTGQFGPVFEQFVNNLASR